MKCPECRNSTHGAPAEALQAFIQKEKFFKKTGEENGCATQAYSVFDSHEAFVINRGGVIAAIKESPTDWMNAENEGMMERLLKK